MKSKLILYILLLSNLFSETLFFGNFGEDLKNLVITNYKTSSTLGYNTARDTMYLRVDRINGEIKGIYTNYSIFIIILTLL